MPEQLDCVVVGAGVVGLAIARSCALAGREVVVLEAESEIGMHTSSRNSEVIHAGIYYEEKSLKARFCVAGRDRLYRYCDERQIPHQRIGKLIVATNDADEARLHEIQANAVRNGVDDLKLVSAATVREIEPAIAVQSGLYSPSTGIIDSHALMLSMQADIEARSGTVLTHSRLLSAKIVERGFRFAVEGVDESFECRTFVNAAGLWAADLANSIDSHRPSGTENAYFAKGHYFSYQGRSPFKHLVYPLPSDGGLGVHATNDMGGSARFGPDVEWIDEIDYSFDESRKSRFVASIRKFYPDLDESKLTPAYTGIRAKLAGSGMPARDFLIQGPEDHGVDGLVHLLGIESPGLTSSLAIADHVTQLVSR